MAALTLSNYHLGDLLGRGASGSVYRALNFLTGETVAIKSISLLTLSPSLLPDIMSEIDLLKNLNHPNIVKYKGFARDKENLFIVLEYCENGSLQTILKKFGKFPESLVAVYVSQVLEGLIYLHEQGVIHRDIKGANILTNKDGSVKLADFGVSSKAATAAGLDGGGGNDNEVVGSPYWMAPEVIEQSGASTASDIWSVGCVVVELLEGRPPYGDLVPMQALWRIVQGESMRVPDGASAIVKDFLYHCFQKDPNLRITAKKLLRHPWMVSARKHLEPPPAPALPLKPAPPTEPPLRPGNIRATTPAKLPPKALPEKIKKPMTVYDEAVQRVQEWNQALNASPKGLGTLRRIPPSRNSHPRNPSIPASFPSHPSTDSLSAQPASSTNHSPAHGTGGLVQKNIHVTDVLNRAREKVAESWDDDFAADMTISNLAHRRGESSASEEPDQKTMRPLKSPAPLLQSLPETPAARSVSDSYVEDYSDMVIPEDETGLTTKFADLKLKTRGRRAIMHPDDLRKVKTIAPPPAPQRSISTPSRPLAPMTSQPSRSTPGLGPPRSPRPAIRSPPPSRQESLRSMAEVAEGQLELNKYSETDDDDFSDIFAGNGEQSTLADDVSDSKTTASLQLTRRSNISWLGDEEDDTNDAFAEIGDDFSGETDDLEANLIRDKRATLCASINRIVDLLQSSTPNAALITACDELLALFGSAPDIGLEAYFVDCHGMLAVLEVLESRLSREAAVRLLQIVNTVVSSDVEALESFCLIGGIPVIIPFTTKKQSLDTRLEASTFVQHLTRSALTLQMFISCRGLRILVELLDEDYSVNKTLILSSLEGISSVFDLQSPTPRNDFCRMFVREGILDPLSTALLSILNDTTLQDEEPGTRAINVLLLFCQIAQADARIREVFATRTIMIRLLKACELLPRKLLIIAIKAIKHLSTSPQLIEVLQNSNAMEFLVSLLGKNIKGSHSNEICSHIFQTVFSMCRLSKARQEEAASSGIIPLLKRVIQHKSPLKQFALPILCDMANAGKVSRRLLWQNEGIKLYLDLLDDPYWRVNALDAILAWMHDETARVEDKLLEKPAIECLVKAFVQASGASFEGILDPLLKILRLSTSVTSSISTTPFFRRLSEALDRQSKAVVKLNLLRLTRVICDNHPDRATLVSRFDVARIVDRLAKQDDAVLVRELAKEIHPTLLFGTDLPEAGGPGAIPKRVLSVVKRTTSEPVVTASNLAESKEEKGKDVGIVTPVKKDEGERHKRKISRSQLRDVHWQTDENGRLTTVRTPLNATREIR